MNNHNNNNNTGARSTIVELNVGGQRYTTSLATLQRDPDSMLKTMFDEPWISATQQQEQNISNNNVSGSSSTSSPVVKFIDRDGTHFRYILNYLRDGIVDVTLPVDHQILRELQAEANFYQLNELKQLIDVKLSPPPLSPSVSYSFGTKVCWKLNVIKQYWLQLLCLTSSNSGLPGCHSRPNSNNPRYTDYILDLICSGCRQEIQWFYSRPSGWYQDNGVLRPETVSYTKAYNLYRMRQMRGVIVELIDDCCCKIEWSRNFVLHLPLDAVMPMISITNEEVNE